MENKTDRYRESCAIGVDNKFVIQTLETDLTNPGHLLAAEAVRIEKHLKNRNGSAKYSLVLRWTAGHVGIEGNERADREAKHAALGQISNKRDLPR